MIETEPLDIYSRQELPNEHIQDIVYGTNEEFNTLFYDIDCDSDNEDSEMHYIDSHTDNSVSQYQSFASISKSDLMISTFCTHSKIYTIHVSCSS